METGNSRRLLPFCPDNATFSAALVTVASYLAALQSPLERRSPVPSLEDDLYLSSGDEEEEENEVLVPETPETLMPESPVPPSPVAPELAAHPEPEPVRPAVEGFAPPVRPEARVAPTVTVEPSKKKAPAPAAAAPQLVVEIEPLLDLTVDDDESEADDTDADPDFEVPRAAGESSDSDEPAPRERRRRQPKRPLRDTRHYDSECSYHCQCHCIPRIVSASSDW